MRHKGGQGGILSAVLIRTTAVKSPFQHFSHEDTAVTHCWQVAPSDRAVAHFPRLIKDLSEPPTLLPGPIRWNLLPKHRQRVGSKSPWQSKGAVRSLVVSPKCFSLVYSGQGHSRREVEMGLKGRMFLGRHACRESQSPMARVRLTLGVEARACPWGDMYEAGTMIVGPPQ